jgi:ferric-dicitrate binding protein FerR (iron transport regulator)
MNNLEPIDNKWNDLIIKFLNGELSHSDEMELQNWIGESSDHYRIFEQYRAVWLQSTVKAQSKADQQNRAWQNISKSIDTVENQTPVKNIHRFRYFLKIAAILVIVFFIGFLTSKYVNNTDSLSAGKVCQIITPLGSKTYLVLPDGSQVWLNAGSKLTYSKAFDTKERKVSLVGEAFFKVKTNKNKPFIVYTGQMNVRAYGTMFNVKAYPDDKIISTTLVEGIVKVDGIEGKKKFSYTLKPSQNITIRKNGSIDEKAVVVKSKKETTAVKAAGVLPKIEIVKEVKTELYTSWKDARWNIEGEPLNTLAVLLERRFNTKIHVDADDLNKYKFTGIIQNETLEQVLQFLSYTTPLNYQIGKGEVWWSIDQKKALQYSKILNNPPSH